MLLKILMVVNVFIFSNIASADDQFVCGCVATGPGYENTVGPANKICSYSCDCDFYSEHTVTTKVILIQKLVSTAKSFESWDFGSQICHGQYAWRPTLDAPNWRIVPRFSTFSINTAGMITYLDSAQIAPGFHSALPRTETAPEILEVLKTHLF